MFLLRILVTTALTLGLSGCFVGSMEPFVPQSEAKAVLPTTIEGVFSVEDEQDEDVLILREPGSNDYTMRLLSEPDSNPPTRLRFFGIGNTTMYGVQIEIPKLKGEVVYGLIRLRQTESVQIDLYAFNVSEEWLDRRGISYSGGLKSGVMLQSKRDLDEFMTGIMNEQAYQISNTIRTWPGGFAARSKGDTGVAESMSGFITDGYFAGDLLAAIYNGHFNDLDAYTFSPYLLEFGTYLNQLDGDPPCLTLFTQRVRTQLPMMATGRSLEIMVGALYKQHSNSPGGRERAFTEGLVAGAEFVEAIAALTLSGKEDASLFYKRHGCSSRTSNKFFNQFNEFVVSGSQ